MSDTAFQFLTLTAEKAKSILNRCGIKCNNPTVAKFEQGMVNDVFLVDDTYVVKVNTGHPDIPKLKKEAVIFNVAKAHTIPTPDVIAYDDSNEIIDFSYLVMSKINGETLSTLSPVLTDNKKSEVTRSLGKMLGRIHSINCSEYALNEVIVQSTDKEVSARVKALIPELKATKLLSEKELNTITSCYLVSDTYATSEKQSILHGNFAPANVLVERSNVTGIIDWEWSSLGNAEEELAVVLYRGLLDERLRDDFIDGYKEICTIDAAFEDRYVGYVLLYYLKVLPSVPEWTHKPEKQAEYISETKKLISLLH